MVDKIENKYNYNIEQKSKAVTYTVGSGENLSCFLKEFAKKQNYQSSDNKITNEEWAMAYRVLKEKQNLSDINKIRTGEKMTFSSDAMQEIMEAMGMTMPSSTQKKPETWDSIQNKYKNINSLKSDEEKVIAWHKQNASVDKKNYVVVDKKNCQAKIYSPDGKLLTSFEVGVGRDKGDDYLTSERHMTTTGIYTVDYKGSGKDSYSKKYNDNIYTLKTDKGASGVALHQIPNKNTNRYQKMHNGNLADNRYSNGCVNFTKEDFNKLEKYIKMGTKVYVLPEDQNNYFIVKNGQLNLTQKHFTGQVLTSKMNREAKAIDIKFKNQNYHNSQTISFVKTLKTEKKELMQKLNIDNDTYNNLSMISLGIVGQETEYGESFKYKIKENYPDTVSVVKSIVGNNSYNSKGLTQMKIKSYTDVATKKLLAEYGITEDNLSNPEKSALATIIVLASMYKNELPGLQEKLEKQKIDKMDALLYLWNGKKKEITNNTATPNKNIYIRNVKKFANENFTIIQS